MTTSCVAHDKFFVTTPFPFRCKMLTKTLMISLSFSVIYHIMYISAKLHPVLCGQVSAIVPRFPFLIPEASPWRVIELFAGSISAHYFHLALAINSASRHYCREIAGAGTPCQIEPRSMITMALARAATGMLEYSTSSQGSQLKVRYWLCTPVMYRD